MDILQEKRNFRIDKDFSLSELSKALELYLSGSKSLKTQRFESGDKAIIQCLGDDSEWKKFLGLDAAVTVELQMYGSILTATIGNAKWIDKAGVAFVGAIFFSPLLLTAGIGALRQAFLPEEIFKYIQNQLNKQPFDVKQTETAVCPSCGAGVLADAVFCTKCGTKL